MTEGELGAFTARFGRHPVALRGGTQLYKYSGPYPYNDTTHAWSAWWNARSGTQHVLEDGRKVSWTGLSSHLTKAMKGGFSDVREARVRSAVKTNWNSMNNLFIATLEVDVAWAWLGQCKGQRTSDSEDPEHQKLYFIGGSYQYYIPALQRHELRILSASCGSDEGM